MHHSETHTSVQSAQSACVIEKRMRSYHFLPLVICIKLMKKRCSCSRHPSLKKCGSEKSRFVLQRQASDWSKRSLAAAANFRRGRLLGQKHGLDVGQNSTLSDRHPGQQLVQLLVVADGQLQVTRDDARLLVVACRVAGKLEHLSGQVLHHGSQVDRRSGTDSLRVVALAQQTVYTTDGELQTSTARSALCLSLHLATLAASRH